MEYDLLLIYKALRLPLLGLAIVFITFYVYNRKRKEHFENPKYRMLEED